MDPKNKKVVTVGIIGGKGKMGNYFAQVFKQAGCTVLISDLGTKLTNEQLAAKADVVIISVPIAKTASVIKKVVHKIRPGAAIIDLTSLKVFPVEEMLKGMSEVIGLHPMFGHTNPLPGQTIIASPVRGKKWFQWLKNILEEQGAHLEILKPEDHDRIMALVQGLVHFADITFASALKDLGVPVKKYLKYSGPASELKIAFAARLMAQDPELYASIQLYNPFALEVVNKYAESVKKLIEIIEKKDLEGFKKYFNEASKNLSDYTGEAFDDTNYLIHALLNRRIRKSVTKLHPETMSDADIAILGPAYTNSDFAADDFCAHIGKKLEKTYCQTISEIFLMVEKGLVKRGIAPLENLLQGSIRETLDNLFYKNVHIAKKFQHKISYALVGLPGTKKTDISAISSHEQALDQCGDYVRKHFPGILLEKHPSTISALEEIIGTKDRHTAAIIPRDALKFFDVEILAENIQSQQENSTSFIVIEKGPFNKNLIQKPKRGAIFETSIAFYFHRDRPGSLFTIFKDFADVGINLTRIESRPSPRDLGNYVFYLDFRGGASDPRVQNILKIITKKVAKLKVLGSYQMPA